MELINSFNNKYLNILHPTTGMAMKLWLQNNRDINLDDYYLLSNGKLVKDDSIIDKCHVHVVPRLLGGKGGFGSMLRAIGAQIEKTTNREACRDLSGRRLRDINEEKRLKNWINQQAEREKEALERKKKKLEKLCETPKHEFKDDEYQKERSEIPEVVEDAVTQGLQASCSSKRKITDKQEPVKKKKPKLWVDDLVDEELSSGDSESDTSETVDETKSKVGSSEGNDDEPCSSSEEGKNLDIDTTKGLNTDATKENDTKEELIKPQEEAGNK